ncbi:hypothetical protein TIFTF001_031906 [Ficus carica]|uniref:Uncharacterized protein n=1 Tax=Ficus carica TaxID=3494 RepID=A0AA88DZ53_FICCA|nr:hypothetical protein TIFTF001_031906 [Ficus carica]
MPWLRRLRQRVVLRHCFRLLRQFSILSGAEEVTSSSQAPDCPETRIWR